MHPGCHSRGRAEESSRRGGRGEDLPLSMSRRSRLTWIRGGGGAAETKHTPHPASEPPRQLELGQHSTWANEMADWYVLSYPWEQRCDPWLGTSTIELSSGARLGGALFGVDAV